MKLEYCLIPFTEISSKWIKDLNIRPETIKLPEENLGEIFLYLNLEAMATKAKINKWDYIKLKSFCTVKKTMNKIKGQPERRYLHIMYLKGINTQNAERTTTQWQKYNLIRKWVEELIDISPKKTSRCPRDTWKDAQLLSSLIIGEVQVKITMRYPLTPVRIIKKTKNNKRWQGCGEKRILVYSWSSHSGKECRGSSKN